MIPASAALDTSFDPSAHPALTDARAKRDRVRRRLVTPAAAGLTWADVRRLLATGRLSESVLGQDSARVHSTLPGVLSDLVSELSRHRAAHRLDPRGPHGQLAVR